MATITVNTTVDINNPNDGLITLRDAIEQAISGDTIDFSVGKLDLDEHPLASERAARLLQITASAPIDDWQQVDMPVSVVGYANDPFYPPEVANQLVEHLPNAHYAEIPATFENPDQHIYELQETVRDFLPSL